MSESIQNKVIVCPVCHRYYVPFFEGDDDLCDACIAKKEVMEQEAFDDERTF